MWIRLSLRPPWVHKQPEMRRGMQFATDVRFCFTTFEDNEQFESGDTLTHTWYKPDWPVCTTKWLYLWGQIAGQACVSTTPPFKYHNDGVSPVPTPDFMHTINSIEPQYNVIAGSQVWNTFDSSHDIPVGATGVLVIIENTSSYGSQYFGLRKNGSTFAATGSIAPLSIQAALVGVDADRKWQGFAYTTLAVRCWVYGYTSPNVIFLPTPISIKPAMDDVYHDVDLSASCPGAILILTELSSTGPSGYIYSIRAKGSTKELYKLGNHAFPFVAAGTGGKIQVKATNPFGYATLFWHVIGYIKTGVTVNLNPTAIVVGTGSWADRTSNLARPLANFTFAEIISTVGTAVTAMRKGSSLLDLKRSNDKHGFWIACMPTPGTAGYYKADAGTNFYTLAVTE